MGYPKHLVIRPYSSVTTLADERKRVTPLPTSFDIIAPLDFYPQMRLKEI